MVFVLSCGRVSMQEGVLLFQSIYHAQTINEDISLIKRQVANHCTEHIPIWCRVNTNWVNTNWVNTNANYVNTNVFAKLQCSEMLDIHIHSLVPRPCPSGVARIWRVVGPTRGVGEFPPPAQSAARKAGRGLRTRLTHTYTKGTLLSADNGRL